jgi:hypothetical protein
MYNLLFGENPNSKILLAMLNLSNEKGKCHIGRYRDVYLSEDGTQIIVYTRNGGGNRECEDCVADNLPFSASEKEHLKVLTDCTMPDSGSCFWSQECCPLKGNASMKLHPQYVSDKDDDYDCTYAYFTFNVPDQYKEFVQILKGKEEPNVTQKFNTLIEEMKLMPKEQIEADLRFKPFVELLKKIQEGNK